MRSSTLSEIQSRGPDEIGHPVGQRGFVDLRDEHHAPESENSVLGEGDDGLRVKDDEQCSHRGHRSLIHLPEEHMRWSLQFECQDCRRCTSQLESNWNGCDDDACFECATEGLIEDCERDEMTHAFPVELVREMPRSEFTCQVNEASTTAAAAPSEVRAAVGEHYDQPTDVQSVGTPERVATSPAGREQNLVDEEVPVSGSPTEA